MTRGGVERVEEREVEVGSRFFGVVRSWVRNGVGEYGPYLFLFVMLRVFWFSY